MVTTLVDKFTSKNHLFSTAYKEKMKELSVLSLICSCFYPEARNNLVCEFEGKIYMYLKIIYIEPLITCGFLVVGMQNLSILTLSNVFVLGSINY